MTTERVPIDQFEDWLMRRAVRGEPLEHTEKIAHRWLQNEYGKNLKQVYCWFYNICMACGEPSYNHMDEWKCPFAPTQYSPAF